jgi:hypothetical protein
MSHRRIRPFNMRDTYPEQDRDNDRHPAYASEEASA